MKEYMDLFGERRWRAIEIYYKNLQKILSTTENFIPWDRLKIQTWMNDIRSP